ncbi:hypothetical protein GMDG_07318 [Pseudogymnoascus destructans 20631-21]|uniref:DUF4939 domain-containing protein n=1 Tax=Pseudogymnoascus destructans (strain ATCC MYA-4855 / 20631-21) TaxID=658429 RepID=L8FWK7_PSED2|nr:hypothetical protein GMDG_07318 [Pseudogymnoascus destructans 20631-21]
MAGDDTGSNIGLKGKVATEPTIKSPLAHPSDKLNITFPDTFYGDRKKLKSFLIQTELWMAFNAKHFNKEVEQILWAVPLFRGPASEWISNYLANYMNHRTPDEKCNTSTSQGTKEIFVSWNGFLKTLKALKQRGSAVAYTAEFQQHATLTNWGEEAICDQFYAGLKDHVKDEISRSDKPDDLREMIELAQKIDNRHYEWQLEKKGGQPSQHWTQKRREESLAPTYGTLSSLMANPTIPTRSDSSKNGSASTAISLDT